MINIAAANIQGAFARAHDCLNRGLTDKDQLRKRGPQHRHHKHGWDFNTLGASYLVRHARRHANLGATAPALTLRALAVPAGAGACIGLGIIPKVAMATIKWPWYYGYENAQGDESLRKDLVQFELQEAVAELQVVGNYADAHPAHKTSLRPFWQDARRMAETFKTELDDLDPKIGGSTRLRKKLRHYKRLLDTHAG